MALNGSELIIVGHLVRLKDRPQILSLGYPDLLIRPDFVERFLPELRGVDIATRPDSHAVARDHGWPPGLLLYDAYAFFAALGGTLTVIDFADLGHGESVANLNRPVDQSWYDRFDIIIDPGTIEHCFNVATAMENIVRMLRVGGFVFHQDAISFPNHGFFSLSPTFFVDFYASNGFQIAPPRCFIMGAARNADFVRWHLVKLLKINQAKEYQPIPRSPAAVIGEYVVQKVEGQIGPKPREVVWPIQYKYGNNASRNLRFARWVDDAFADYPDVLGGDIEEEEKISPNGPRRKSSTKRKAAGRRGANVPQPALTDGATRLGQTRLEQARLDLPVLLEIEPTLGCNLRCVMCHVPTMKEKARFLDVDVLERQTRGLRDCHVIIGSEYEPTIHPEFEKLLKLAANREWKVDLLSNATNFHNYDPALFSQVRFNVFNVSFDGHSKEAFERIRRGADYATTMRNILRAADAARSSGAYTAVNATMLRSNLHETADLIRLWDREGFDLVRLFVMQVRQSSAELFQESLYPILGEVRETLRQAARVVADNRLRIGVRSAYYGMAGFELPPGVAVREGTVSSDNPDYRHVPDVRQASQSGVWPGMQWPCKSPFVYARIRWDGSVDLCNKRNFTIGNIYEQSFEEIWNGAKAQALRQQIEGDVSTCERCDYFRFSINSQNLDLDDPQSHFTGEMFRNPKTISWLWSLPEVDRGGKAIPWPSAASRASAR